MRAALARINEERNRKGLPAVRHGIGVHTGTVLAGNVGSPERMVYAMVGDTVNVASRLQVLNKTLGTDILISGRTRERVAGPPQRLHSMGRHAIRGKTEAVEVYSPG
jgi:adenylate cyclase